MIFARAFLAARGSGYEVLWDTACDDLSNRMYGYVILTDYEEHPAAAAESHGKVTPIR